LKEAFSKCQRVEEDEAKDKEFRLDTNGDGKPDDANRALWYRVGWSPAPEFKMKEALNVDSADKE
jgi:hypothetical protein